MPAIAPDPTATPDSGAPQAPPPTPSATPSLPAPGSIPMFDPSDPTGPPKMIDPSQVDAAQQMGGELAFKMIDPQDKQAKWIRHSQLQAAADAGGTPANMHEATRIQKALAPVNSNDSIGTGTLPIRQKLAIGPMGSAADAPIGALRGVAKTYKGLGDIGRKVAHAAASAVGLTPKDQGEYSDPITRFADEEDATPGEKAGDVLETIAEYLWGEGEVKAGMEATGAGAVKLGDRYKAVSEGLKAVEKLPTALQEGIASMIRNGTVSGAQSLVKSGGDVDQAAEGAALGAGTAGLLEGGGRLASDFVDTNRATTEMVNGREVTVPAEVRNARPTPQQAEGQKVIEDAAKDATRRNLEEVNQDREYVPGPAALPAESGPYKFRIKGDPTQTEDAMQVVPARAKHIGTDVRMRAEGPATESGSTPGGNRQVVKVPRYQYLTGAKPGSLADAGENSGAGDLVTEDPTVVRGHIGKLNEAINSPDFDELPEDQQQAILDQRADAQRQMSEYHASREPLSPYHNRPAFEPVDVRAAVRRTASYTDAADELHSTHQEVYKRLNDMTGDRFNALRQANKDAWNELKNASGIEQQAASQAKVDQTNRDMMAMLEELKGAARPGDLASANQAFRNEHVLRSVGDAIDGSFSPNQKFSQSSGAYRGFDGNLLSARLQRVVKKLGRPQVERVIGAENLRNIERIADLNRTNANRAKFGQATDAIASYLSGEGGGGRLAHLAAAAVGGMAAEATGTHFLYGVAAGEGLHLASKMVMRKVLTDPKVARQVLFAIDSGARPEFYAPFIAGLIRKEQKGQQQ